jgi:hypothetical protein
MAALVAFLCLGQKANARPAGQAPAQTSPPQAAAPATDEKPHGPMPAVLTKPLDSKKLKEGDVVTARITAELHMRSGETIPRDSKLTGHVTKAEARSKGDPQSALGIVFDKITLPDGKDMAIKGVLQAIGPSLTASGPPDASQSIGPGMMAGHEGAQGAGTTPPSMGGMSQTTRTSAPVLNGQSKGVIGIKNLELGDNSVLLSSGKEIRLDSGTQLIVLTEIE